jgi:hypothetical protein
MSILPTPGLRALLLAILCLSPAWAGQAPAEKLLRLRIDDITYVITDPSILDIVDAMSRSHVPAAPPDGPTAEALFGSKPPAVVDAKGRVLMEIRRSGEVVAFGAKELAVPPELARRYNSTLIGDMQKAGHLNRIGSLVFKYYRDGLDTDTRVSNRDERNLAIITRLLARVPRPPEGAKWIDIDDTLVFDLGGPVDELPATLYARRDASALWVRGTPVELDDAMRADLRLLIDYATPLVMPKVGKAKAKPDKPQGGPAPKP